MLVRFGAGCAMELVHDADKARLLAHLHAALGVEPLAAGREPGAPALRRREPYDARRHAAALRAGAHGVSLRHACDVPALLVFTRAAVVFGRACAEGGSGDYDYAYDRRADPEECESDAAGCAVLIDLRPARGRSAGLPRMTLVRPGRVLDPALCDGTVVEGDLLQASLGDADDGRLAFDGADLLAWRGASCHDVPWAQRCERLADLLRAVEPRPAADPLLIRMRPLPTLSPAQLRDALLRPCDGGVSGSGSGDGITTVTFVDPEDGAEVAVRAQRQRV